jgi:hypothetical protein
MAAVLEQSDWNVSCSYGIAKEGIRGVEYNSPCRARNICMYNTDRCRIMTVHCKNRTTATWISAITYAFFWVIPRRPKLICRRFGTLCLFPYKCSNILNPSHSSHLPAYEDGTEYSETSAYVSDAGELPRRKHTPFRTRRNFEIKNRIFFFERRLKALENRS